MTERAIVLLSGGVDSAVALAIARRQGFEVSALSFRYGQRHVIELDAARTLAARYEVARHLVVDIGVEVFGGSILTGGSRSHGGPGSPSTYVPARNTLFLSYALGWSEVLHAGHIFIGANADDAAGYPDCREAYLRAFERMADLATHAGSAGGRKLAIHAPLLHLTKAEVVALGRSLAVPLDLTWSCYFPTDAAEPCGECDACQLRHGTGLVVTLE